MPKLISQKNFSNITIASLTTTSTSQVPLDIFSKQSFISAKYQIQITQGSNYHTTEFSVFHESPQVILIKNGECSYDESHSGINMDDIKEQATSQN